jgi:hypothetical protein
VVDSESPDAYNAATAAAAASATSGLGSYDMIIGTSVLDSIAAASVTAAASFLQWDAVDTLKPRYPIWLRCTLHGCSITLSGTLPAPAAPVLRTHALHSTGRHGVGCEGAAALARACYGCMRH